MESSLLANAAAVARMGGGKRVAGRMRSQALFLTEPTKIQLKTLTCPGEGCKGPSY